MSPTLAVKTFYLFEMHTKTFHYRKIIIIVEDVKIPLCEFSQATTCIKKQQKKLVNVKNLINQAEYLFAL